MQSISSKNSNILNRFESKDKTGELNSFLISIDGKKNMNYLSRVFTTRDDVMKELEGRFPHRVLKFVE